MGYTALEKMHERNLHLYGIAAPQMPQDYRRKKNIHNLERECLSFLREDCEQLRLDPALTALEDQDGRSIGPNQIPFNMEKDLDRACLEQAIHRFMASGNANDAFDVYFCYLEMFVGPYASSKNLFEMLADFESNASSLLMKHRDHYSHSVYVFLLGLAIYRNNRQVRETYQSFYQLSDLKQAAHHFLHHWGMTALFHDIGYPFELPFEQVKSYFNNTTEGVPFVAYRGLEPYIKLNEQSAEVLSQLLGAKVTTINDVLSYGTALRLGGAYALQAESLCSDVLARKPSAPDKFGGYMDHAYFSGVLLAHHLIDLLGPQSITMPVMDAISAITLHNSLYKYSVTNVKKPNINKPLAMELHPLAYLLMLCDELQCWDRTSYGQNSRQELHAMWCDLEFSENEIHAHYQFDAQLEYKKAYAEGTYPKMTNSENTFLKEIEAIIRINEKGSPNLSVTASFEKNTRLGQVCLSESSYTHLYQFAVALNGRYRYGNDHVVASEQLEADFNQLSLEYKLSNLMQAKAFASYLERIGCFYTDRPVNYELLDHFTSAQMDVIGPMEHTRWVTEKESMGWSFDERYADHNFLLAHGVDEASLSVQSKRLREQTRTHTLIVADYDELDAAEQSKDTDPMDTMLHLIQAFDGLRIFRMS